ncbi:hypothetical protein ACHAXA_004227 [Cyclostephanos tholiformis]|uniref:Uncharacterized protein n=1 Tax=Cyclostephanos tholiformis TaxID=382380 RepID=A0ABD3RDU9_9STRA
MFSANENIMLRQHKRRVVEWVESTIPDDALELGTTVMAMQVSCREPGCVPLETAITIVFPRPPRTVPTIIPDGGRGGTTSPPPSSSSSFPRPLVPGVEESRIGGSFKTRILMPLSDVTLEDVLDALPPSFKGGRRTMESLCLKARDMTFARIGQLVGNDDTIDRGDMRRVVAEYLRDCLDEYIARGCKAPEWGGQYATPLDDGKMEDTMPSKAEVD